MTTRYLMMLPLAAALVLPAAAQTDASPNQDQNQPAQTQTQAQNANSDQNLTAHQPLVPEEHQGFWGKLNPFARKKYVQRQMSPIRNRVNELDDLTAANAKNIQDVDSRAQEGIRQASAKANEADQHALEAGRNAQQANQTAQQATTRLQTVEQVVTNYDQYAPTNETEIRFRSGQTILSKRAKDALDELATSLKDQKNYIIEVQGFAPGSSAASVQSSQKMANAVVRYLVINHEIPVYRVYTLGMGNAKVQSASAQNSASGQEGTKAARPYRGPRVEVSVLKNSSIDQLNTQAMATPQSSFGASSNQSGTSGAASQSMTNSSSSQSSTATSNSTGISYDNQTKPSAQQPSPEMQSPAQPQ